MFEKQGHSVDSRVSHQNELGCAVPEILERNGGGKKCG